MPGTASERKGQTAGTDAPHDGLRPEAHFGSAKSLLRGAEVGELPAVAAHRAQMRQLFRNLISNALKLHEEGQAPVVEVRA